MTRVVWGTAGERFYEAGVDRGVLYPQAGPGVPWNGLINVNEQSVGGDVTGYYLDGLKILNLMSQEDFEATIEAFSAPPEFAACDGTLSLAAGLFITQQPRKTFGFSYRTLTGNDVLGLDYGYKIHLVYNALAKPSEKVRATTSDSPDVLRQRWDVVTRPPLSAGFRPSAHLVLDSNKTSPSRLSAVEDILYGSTTTAPRLPTPAELVVLLNA